MTWTLSRTNIFTSYFFLFCRNWNAALETDNATEDYTMWVTFARYTVDKSASSLPNSVNRVYALRKRIRIPKNWKRRRYYRLLALQLTTWLKKITKNNRPRRVFFFFSRARLLFIIGAASLSFDSLFPVHWLAVVQFVVVDNFLSVCTYLFFLFFFFFC